MIGLKQFVGAGFGSGFSPVAPGTIGSFFALIPAYFIAWIHPVLAPILLIIFFLFIFVDFSLQSSFCCQIVYQQQ